MANDSELTLVSQRGWRRGFDNLLDNEFGRWWRTRRWWIQSLIWVAVIGFLMGSIIMQGGNDSETVTLIYGIFASIFPAVAVIIQMQSSLIGEKSDGTAAWVLSKPASRPAFILAKLVANSLSVLVTTVLIPGLVAYPLLSYRHGPFIEPADFPGRPGRHLAFPALVPGLHLDAGGFPEQPRRGDRHFARVALHPAVFVWTNAPAQVCPALDSDGPGK